jgi:hypothetical protein
VTLKLTPSLSVDIQLTTASLSPSLPSARPAARQARQPCPSVDALSPGTEQPPPLHPPPSFQHPTPQTQANGDNSAYWRVLSDAGLLQEVSSIQHAIHSSPPRHIHLKFSPLIPPPPPPTTAPPPSNTPPPPPSQANGDNNAYWRVLSDAGITRQRLESFDRPVRCEPEWFGSGKKHVLIREFRNYLGILKAVHSGGCSVWCVCGVGLGGGGSVFGLCVGRTGQRW